MSGVFQECFFVLEKEGLTSIPTRDNHTLLVKRTVRSGQRITYAGNIVIMGDVNPGGEVIAEGSVIVMGDLKGVVHAGSSGDEKAVVIAFRLKPIQLRIAGFITRSPDEGESRSDHPEIAHIQDGNVVIEKYHPGCEKI
ncbi:MAG: septum site-determining protein MinC [Clostridia bacterium]|nr:septum site-determining protein MinC [Clostridia bacterium]